jgi:peptide-methionine (R)-S-oxide reductase
LDTPKQINPGLTDAQKDVLLHAGTEAPFSGTLLDNHGDGDYRCANCGTVLFHSDAKYDSDIPGLAGWPSFADVAEKGTVELRDDTSHGMQRTEVICATCGGHLGHLFPDDSSPSGQHYCINSAALDFKKRD